MKRIACLLTSLSLVFSLSNVFAQNVIKSVSPSKFKKAGTFNMRSFKAHKPMGTTNYAFLDYPIDDSLLANGHYTGGTFLGSPSVGQFYVQEMNMHYTMSDSGKDANGAPVNALLIHDCAVAFDTLLDATSGMGYASTGVSNVMVDSLYIPIAQSNASGKNDTLVVEIVSVSATGTPTTTVLWSQSLIQDTGFSGKGNSTWSTTIHVLALNPKLTLASGSKFAVELNYYDESKKDTCAFLWGAPGYNCTALGGDIPDTTMIGTNLTVGTKHLRANSFTTGYNYFTGGKPSNSNPVIGLPSATYGDAFTYGCTSSNDTTLGLYWQDIAIFAEVSFTTGSVTGVNSVADNGFSVGQNYPNPFNQTTQITFNLVKAADVQFSVYDMTGRKLISNSYNEAAPGQHIISLNANQFTPGVYFYTFEVNGTSVTKKMIITE